MRLSDGRGPCGVFGGSGESVWLFVTDETLSVLVNCTILPSAAGLTNVETGSDDGTADSNVVNVVLARGCLPTDTAPGMGKAIP